MYFKGLVTAFLILAGAAGINSVLKINEPISAALTEETYKVYVWIDNVRWAYIYSFDGNLIISYPDPEE